MEVYLELILIAEVPLTIEIDRDAVTGADQAQVAVNGHAYRKIFASYSHKDLDIVRQFEEFTRAFGDEFIRDWTHLRSGQSWSEELKRMIDDANVFQLFWSNNSIESDFVRQEWQHALGLKRQEFIRPVYWEEPMPQRPEKGLPPAELAALHFHKFTPADNTSLYKSSGEGQAARPIDGHSRISTKVENRAECEQVRPPSPLTLRIFISSPGDVPVERDRAADVIARLQEEFVHYAVSSLFSGKTSPRGRRTHSSLSSPRRRRWTSSSASSGPGSALRSPWTRSGQTAGATSRGRSMSWRRRPSLIDRAALPTSSFTAGQANPRCRSTTRPSGSAGWSSSRRSRHSSGTGSSTTTARSRRPSTPSRRPTNSSSSSRPTFAS